VFKNLQSTFHLNHFNIKEDMFMENFEN